MSKKNATLDNYVLGKTLGAGYHAKVKLAGINNNQYAAKIFKSTHSLASNMKTLQQEIGVMQKLNHPNLVNLIEVIPNGTYTKKNGQQYQALGIVLEYCAGGELFEYVANTGRFSEPVARAYFHQLMNSLEYLHGNNISHRDLKPENLLFDHQFNLKVADFGFATLMEGRDGSGLLKTCLGTESYMAPEIHAKQSYIGSQVDLFAAGIILFIMLSGTPPFTKADPKDPYYKLLCTNRYDSFWQAHLRNKPSENFFSNDFMNFINSILAFDPQQRLSLAEVKSHPWFNGPVATMDQIRDEFKNRYHNVQAQLEKQRLEKQQQKLKEKEQQQGNLMYAGTQKFRSVEEVKNEFEGLDKKFNFEINRELREADSETLKMTDFLTTVDHEYLFKFLLAHCNDYSKKIEVSDKCYRIKCVDTDSNQNVVEFTVELKKVDDDVCMLDFQRQRGLVMQHFDAVNKIKKLVEVL